MTVKKKSAKKKARGRPRKAKPVDISSVPDERLNGLVVRWTFPDGSVGTLDAKAVKDSHQRQTRVVRQEQGRMGGLKGRKIKEPDALKLEIHLLFGERWLSREKMNFLRAREQARAWVAKEIAERHPELSKRSVQRAVSDALGRKKARRK